MTRLAADSDGTIVSIVRIDLRRRRRRRAPLDHSHRVETCSRCPTKGSAENRRSAMGSDVHSSDSKIEKNIH